MGLRKKALLLCSLSGILLGFSWPAQGTPYLLFFAFVPLLIVEDTFRTNLWVKKKVAWAFFYITFLIWNICSTWWVAMAKPSAGGIMAIVANALLMSLVFLLFHALTKKLPDKLRLPILGFMWISFEFLHLDWDLTWPWLTLGNAFGNNIFLIQWYEYTGVFGGSAWVLAVNFLIFLLIKKGWMQSRSLQLAALGAFLIPIVISYFILRNVEEPSGDEIDVVVVQPNVDPYNEKFSGTYEQQLSRMIALSSDYTDSKTDFVVFPETALTEGGLYEHRIQDALSISVLRKYTENFPGLNIITGATTFKLYEDEKAASVTARRSSQGYLYDAFNTALQISDDGSVNTYHKSKLVPGVEKMPFPRLFRPLEKLAMDLGGTTGSLGIQEERSVFHTKGKARIAPVICYESIFGEYVGQYLRNGANAIFIITNDGWWDDTPGYKQHLAFARLRAIETRTPIARSANTGISAFIDVKGNIVKQLGWWKPGALKHSFRIQSEQTFYTHHGDYIARACLGLALLSLVAVPVSGLFRRKKL